MPFMNAFRGTAAPEAISALRGTTGLMSRLPVRLVRESNPQFGYITGLGGLTGNPPSTACGACQTAGGVRSCIVVLPFGRKCVASEALDVYSILRRLNAGEIVPELIGDFVGEEFVSSVLGKMNFSADELATTGIGYGMWVVATELTRWVSSVIFAGDPTGGTEGESEPVGLDNQVITGRTDIGGAACSSLDSYVVNYGAPYNRTDSGGSVLIREINRAVAVLTERAHRAGLAPVSFALVTSPELRFLLADMWAAAYTATFGYQLTSGGPYLVDLSASSASRDRILSEGALNILGNTVPLVADDGVPVVTGQQTTSSTIYILPMTYAGNRPGVYLQLFDHRMSVSDAERLPFIFTDGGAVQWWVTQTGPCYTVSGSVRPRVVLEVPHLAAKITGIQYTPGTPSWPAPGAGDGVSNR